MKLNFGLLCSILISSFITVYADNGNDFLRYCEGACNGKFLPKLVGLLNNIEVSNSEYANIEPLWRECQYRCYRCFLSTADRAMIYLENMFKIESQSNIRARLDIGRVIDRVDENLRSCYKQWKDANAIEDFESKFE
ncbi:hypothetical protein EDC94DRAFT_668103 [Helicostylum pulchrum]|nr:hypothetical protein EDC94DRAFT_668103 [Helicostylum pulchrum]